MTQYSVPRECLNAFHKVIQDARLRLPSEFLALASRVSFFGQETPVYPVPWKNAEAIGAIKGMEATWVNLLGTLQLGLEPQDITIDTLHASLFVLAVTLITVDGKQMGHPDIKIANRDIHNSLKNRYRQLCTNVYRTKDGRYFHLHGSLNATPSQKMIGLEPFIPHLQEEEKILEVYQKAVAQFTAEELDHEANVTYGQAGTICYTDEEFEQTEQGKAILNCPIYELSPVDSGHPPAMWLDRSSSVLHHRPLTGIKVLEISRIIAAPVVGRTLAEYGATVLRVTCDDLPDADILHPEMNLGKATCSLNYTTPEGKAKLIELIREADVLIDGYRPGSLEKHGFGREDVQKMIRDRKGGIIYLRENTYGWHGPWQGRSGWQQISDCFTGISWGMGRKQGLNEPVVPLFPNSDYGTGTAGACGVMHALHLRATKGGSYNVDVSLSYYNLWLKSLGFYPDDVWNAVFEKYGREPRRHNEDMITMFRKILPKIIEAHPEIMQRQDLWSEIPAPLLQAKAVRTLSPVARFSLTKPGFVLGPGSNGSAPPVWPNLDNVITNKSE